MAQPGVPPRPAAPPNVNALRSAGANALTTLVSGILSAQICRHTGLTLEQSWGVVVGLSAGASWCAARAGSFARDLLHQEEQLPANHPDRYSREVRTFLRLIGGSLG